MKTKTHLLAAAIVATLVQGSALAASDPTDPARDRDPGAPPASAAVTPSPEPAPDNSIAHALKDLADQGIFIRANLTNQYARNLRGGVDQGHTNVGQFNIGADLDLDKLIGTKGSSFHFTVYRDYGDGLNHDVTGTFTKQQSIYKNEFPAWHLGLFAFEQKLLDDRLDLTIGRLGTTAYYAKLSTNCQFQSGTTCGVPRLINSEAGYSLLPSATWAVNARYRTTAHTYVETGVFEVNPTTSSSNGMDFSIGAATGLTIPLEWGWVQPRDFEVKVGVYVSTAPRTDPFYNTKGQSLGLKGGTAAEVDNKRKGAYLLADKVIWRPSEGSSRNLKIFGGVVQQLEDEEIMHQQWLGGLVLTGPFKARPQDTIGLSASMFDLSDKERDYLRDARIRAGGQGSNAAHEYTYELNYGWHVSPGVVLMPNVQYITNPDNSGIPKTAILPRNMLAYGLSLQINFSSMFGLVHAGSNEE